ncbi:type IV secretory system conjugative DNA transfer family protein [Naasia lichenicola]|uniref:type IV secretory system conjugative DNA transfer family protein n=1 Tax=Naasia lichenicola TaxID=2565933 RepID=UPI001E37D7F4|nr:type IV secretory system conjugative DNA transfer family protein [Naasia lichenicola]
MPALEPGSRKPKKSATEQPKARSTPTKQAVPPRRPGPRGWFGRGKGTARVIQPAREWRGTTVQVCGLWPFAVGTGTPMVGVPIGLQLFTGATVCADPISWFQDANLISNPSVFVLGLPGLGKSTLIRRMAAGGAGMGNLPLVLGDLKPDYVDLIAALGGQVITLGRGRGHLNILDPGEATQAAERLRLAGKETERQQVLADAHARRHTMVSALLTILRKQPPTDREESILDAALKVLDEHHNGVPVLGDLLQVLRDAPPEVRAVALDRGDRTRYNQITEDLEASLISLTSGGRLGETFAHPTDVPMMRDRPVVYDVSSIDDTDVDLQAAILLACWSAGFGTVNVANALADAGLEPRRHYLVILDELWRALRAGRGMVDRVDALTRLNRQRGVGLAMISHTMSDLLALAEEDRMKAKGFVERAGMVVAGGLPAAEMPMLTSAVALSRAEQELLASWQDPPAWDPVAGRETEPPGRGKFLIKVGGHPGIPVKVELVQRELAVNDTNKAWRPMAVPPLPTAGAASGSTSGEDVA